MGDDFVAFSFVLKRRNFLFNFLDLRGRISLWSLLLILIMSMSMSMLLVNLAKSICPRQLFEFEFFFGRHESILRNLWLFMMECGVRITHFSHAKTAIHYTFWDFRRLINCCRDLDLLRVKSCIWRWFGNCGKICIFSIQLICHRRRWSLVKKHASSNSSSKHIFVATCNKDRLYLLNLVRWYTGPTRICICKIVSLYLEMLLIWKTWAAR